MSNKFVILTLVLVALVLALLGWSANDTRLKPVRATHRAEVCENVVEANAVRVFLETEDFSADCVKVVAGQILSFKNNTDTPIELSLGLESAFKFISPAQGEYAMPEVTSDILQPGVHLVTTTKGHELEVWMLDKNE